MSDANPYQPAGPEPLVEVPSGELQIRRVSIRPIELMKRAYALMGDQYMLMVGVTLVGILVGSLVPMGIIMGAMMVGIFMCFMQREQFGRTEFGALFKGFDFFLDSFLVMLIATALSFVVIFPSYLLMVAIMFGAMAGTQENPDAAVGVMLVIMPVFFILMMVAMLLIYLPFLFSFQLIADRHLTAMDAVKYSWRASIKNLLGIIWHLFVVSLITYIAALACYIPAFFVIPITFGSMFVLYRDIFGPGTFPPPPLTQGYAVQPPAGPPPAAS
ncbi:hypothetical protein [Roseimaritima ulvae]|uniref:Glycerophosphoryl diester phosphodiesterase membrane domain-containing protein n=1 Tax=Roseimaritima ulvae TaxID=980254 RepID=A0A5B9QMJ8_9BACT|nr:hypothetical protein [Roseimaritima ulvae]QEG40218.1 hypothetical protein UC8_22250 [Roseimaritima ulvae]